MKSSVKLLILCLIYTLMACGGDKSSQFSLSNVQGESQLKTGNPTNVSFTLLSNKKIDDVALIYSLTSIEDKTKNYIISSDTADLNSSGTTINTSFNVPSNLINGDYELKVSIHKSQSQQGLLTANSTLSIMQVKVLTPTEPDLVIEQLQLTNNSFVLPQRPNDDINLLVGRGDLQLKTILKAKYASLKEDFSLSFSLELAGLGTFPLVTTSTVEVNEPDRNTHHRNINKNGKVISRIKGQSRQLQPRCREINGAQSCVIIYKNSRRQLDFDLHINEATFDALSQNNTDDITGNVIINITTRANLTQTEYRLPVVYLQPSPAIEKQSANILAKQGGKSADDSSDVNESIAIESGEPTYISYTTTTTANTLQDSTGNAYSVQSQDVSVVMGAYNEDADGSTANEAKTYPMVTMSTSVNSGSNDDINNTQQGITLDVMGGTVFDFTDDINDSTDSNDATKNNLAKSRAAAKNSSQTSSSADDYNPQDEMVWIHCANQNKKCDITGLGLPSTTQVRYGDPETDRWHYRQITFYATCDNDHFYGNPASGIDKVCQYLVPPAFAPKWVRCAKQGNTCKIDKASIVRYGRDERWNSNRFDYDVVCDNNPQGGNPYSGKDKVCEILTDAGAPPLNYEYKFCAEQNETCDFDGSAIVRFSAEDNGSLYTMYAIKRGPVKCEDNDHTFSDPYKGHTKHCDILKYIDPNTRQDQTNLAWSTQDIEREGNFDGEHTNESGEVDEEKIMAEVEFAKSIYLGTYWGIRLTGEVTISGVVGLKLNGYLDTSTRSYTLIGGPYLNIDSSATGTASTGDGVTFSASVWVTADIAVLDMYAPFTVVLTVKPKVLTAAISLDYFIDMIYGEVNVGYHYDWFGDALFGGDESDSTTIYAWGSLYNTSGNLFKGAREWDISPATDYILPAVKDAFYQVKLGFESMDASRDYVLEIKGTLTSNDIWDAANPNEFVTIDIACAATELQTMTFTGQIDEVIPLLECAEVNISGIRPSSWPEGSPLTFGVRKR
ncbi:MAG: hypothetical protein HRT51_06815 [Colwellia sp.]|nr:hypothetical protein [Colwellia sp.]